jgi:hypothetical protein
LVNWATSLSDQQGLEARLLRFVGANLYFFYFALQDALGVALIWAGGLLDSRMRSRGVRARASVPYAALPLDEHVASPL